MFCKHDVHDTRDCTACRLEALATNIATLRARIAAAVEECDDIERAHVAGPLGVDVSDVVAVRRVRAKLEGR